VSGAAKPGAGAAKKVEAAKPGAAAPLERDAIAEMDALLKKAAATEASAGPKAALAVLEGAAPDVKALGMLHYAKGTLLFRAGAAGAAVAAFREAVRIAPEVPEYAGNLGAALIDEATRGGKGQAALDEAIAVLEEASRGGPKLALVHANLGRAYQVAGRIEDALSCVEAALEIDPKNLSAALGRASLLLQLGQADDSLAALDALLAQDPSCEPAKKARDAVRKRLGK